MALIHSTGLRNFLLSSGFVTAFDTDGRIAILSGSMPARDAIIEDGSHVRLATLTLAADCITSSPASGVATFASITSDSDVDATGTPGFFCMYNNGGTALTSVAGSTDRRLTGTIFPQVQLTTNALTAANGNVLNFAATTGVSVGMNVSGTGILAGTTVIAVSGTTVTLSQSSTAGVSNSTTITFNGDITFDSVSWAQHGVAAISSLTHTAPN